MAKKKKTKKRKVATGRNIYLFDDIDEVTSKSIVKELHSLEKKSKIKPIRLYINSPGGYCDNGFAILDVMLNLKCPIYTIALGDVASMACPIFIAGKKGRRYIGRYAQLMFHPLAAGAHDYIKFAKSRIRNADKVEKMYDDFILENTKIPKKVYLKAKDEELWLGIEDALKYKIADKRYRK